MSRTLEDTYYVIQYQGGRLAAGYKARATPKLYKKKGQALSLAAGSDKVLEVKLTVIGEVPPKSSPT